MKKCKKCGTLNVDIYKFCFSCGHILDETTQSFSQNQQEQSTVNSTNGYLRPSTNLNHHQKNTPVATENDTICITFHRPNNFQYIGNVFRIHVDNIRYDLKNNNSIKVNLSKGNHQISISIFGVFKKKHFCFNAVENVTLICTPNPAAIISNFSAPVKVTDQNGRVY